MLDMIQLQYNTGKNVLYLYLDSPTGYPCCYCGCSTAFDGLRWNHRRTLVSNALTVTLVAPKWYALHGMASLLIWLTKKWYAIGSLFWWAGLRLPCCAYPRHSIFLDWFCRIPGIPSPVARNVLRKQYRHAILENKIKSLRCWRNAQRLMPLIHVPPSLSSWPPETHSERRRGLYRTPLPCPRDFTLANKNLYRQSLTQYTTSSIGLSD